MTLQGSRPHSGRHKRNWASGSRIPYAWPVTPGPKSAALNLGALALLIAILPSLLFLGHWTLRFDVPGTDYSLGLPKAGVAHGEAAAHDHARHCHGNSASCSDVPFAGASAFALMSASVACLGLAGILLALGGSWWLPSRRATVAPEPRPPRGEPALFA